MRYSGLLHGIGIVLASLVIAVSVRAASDLRADPLTSVMPISWSQASFRIIVSPDESKLEKGEILFGMKKLNDGSIVAQSMGLIEATPEECIRITTDYNHYTSIMPYTVESRIVRRFRLAGEYAGARAVDFWARVSVLGFQTRYLIRVVNLANDKSHVYRSFWTLVRNPASVSGCKDSTGQPCENDLDMNIGSGKFEPYKGDPNRTLSIRTMRIKGKNWVQRFGLCAGCGNSMQEVTKAIRIAVMKRH
ncbi:MAG: hypothetical protein P4L43_14140 [Syntrophobacteraceae bacterium]|nr:hypothetical protein [Syntrophobacteraceae bacterium]